MSGWLRHSLPRLGGRYATLAGARIASAFARWYVLLKAAHSLSTVDFALLAIGLSTAELLGGAGDLGADAFVYARPGLVGHPLPRLIRAAILSRYLATTAATCVGAIIFVALDRATLLPVLALVPAMSLQNTANAVLQKQSRFDLMAVSAIVAALVAGLTVIVAATSIPSLESTLATLVLPPLAVAVGTSILGWSYLRPVLVRPGHLLRRSSRVIVSKLGQTAVVGTLVVFYSRLDVLVVAPIRGLSSQADYSAAFRLVEPFFALFAIFSTAALAELGTRTHGDARQAGDRLMRTLRWRNTWMLGIAVVVVAAGCYVLLNFMLRLGPGPGMVALVLGAAIPFRIVNSALTVVLQRFSGFAAVMRAALINASITFPAAALFAWVFGAPGAAAGALAGEVINFAVQRMSLKGLFASRATPKADEHTRGTQISGTPSG